MLSSLLNPAVRLMRGLSMARKFTLVALAFLVPTLYLLWTVTGDRSAAYAFTAKEVQGGEAISAYDAVLMPSLLWRGHLIGEAAGVAGAADKRREAAAQVDAALSQFAAHLEKNGDPLALKSAFETLRQRWNADKAKSTSGVTETTAFGIQTMLAMRGFIEHIANNSNLALDPDADSYALMTAYTSELLRLIDSLGRARAMGRIIASTQSTDAGLFMALHDSDALIVEYRERAAAALQAAAAANPAVAPGLKTGVLDSIQKELTPRFDQEFQVGQPVQVDGAQWFDQFSKAIDETEALRQAAGKELNKLLVEREDRLQTQLWTAELVAGVFILLGLYLLAGFYVSAQSTFAALGRRIAQLGEGDFRARSVLDGGDELAHAGNQLNEAMGHLAGLVRQVRESADEIATGTEQIASANQDLSSRGSSLAAVVEQTSASTAALEETVNVNMASAQEANALVTNAAQIAGKGGNVVQQAVKSMDNITQSSRKIGDIIQVIDSIAFQTNILALNAAVEAARAGEQGRGFAVVASEVRALAQRSAGAAREIKTLIQASIETVNSGGLYVNEAGQTMSEMVRAIERVTTLMGDITKQSQHQARQIRELGVAIRDVDSSVQQNASMVEETAATTASLTDRAKGLAHTAGRFRVSD